MAEHEFEEVIVAPYVVRCAVCGKPKYPEHGTDRTIGANEPPRPWPDVVHNSADRLAPLGGEESVPHHGTDRTIRSEETRND